METLFWQAAQDFTIIFILTTEIISANFPHVPTNPSDRPYAGRIHREDTYA
ncbi:hypothetical protein GU927_008290 [Rhodobacteraceae bacterium HSP-20]|uniref:Uncharacterized protein n=1 Tax=Paragemmobacter amnigenus TaxID=2852097 RepID=A0ABS6J3M9_9RHOB|nr:hypothetical protein [Rhodobacter amnigenus]MBU9697846.1 hypothetical protein [Rhodobacter amnigenus]MBV4389073.1 hypothetical protein [Rhodobacter amnigenus]